MTTDFLRIFNRRDESKRKQNALLEQFKAVAKAKELVAKPAPASEADWLSANNYDRSLFIRQLGDDGLARVMGVDMGSAEGWAQRPDALAPEALARLDRSAYELGMRVGPQKGTFVSEDEPWLKHLASKFTGYLGDIEESGVMGIGGPLFTNKFLFGDPNAVGPPDAAPVSHGMLTDPQDQKSYLRKKGLVGLLSDFWTYGAVEPTVANVIVPPIAAAHILLGGDSKLQENVSRRLDEGEPWGEAVLSAYRETDLPPGTKGAAQTLLDPTNAFVFLGIATKAPQLLKGLGSGAKAAVLGGKDIAQILAESDVARKLTGRGPMLFESKLVGRKAAESIEKNIERAKRLPDLMTAEEALAPTESASWMRAHKGMDVFAPVKAAAGAFDPAARVTDPVKAINMAHGRILASGEDVEIIGSAYIRNMVPFLKLDERGWLGGGVKVAKGVSKRELHIGAFMETEPKDLLTKYKNLSDQQVNFYNITHQLYDEWEDVLKARGVLSDADIAAGTKFGRYYPRNLLDESFRAKLSNISRSWSPGLGVKQTFQLGREHAHIVDGLRTSINYDKDPLALWKGHIRQGVKAIADKDTEALFSAKGLLIDTPAIRKTYKRQSALNRAVGKYLAGDETQRDVLLAAGDEELTRAVTKESAQALKDYRTRLGVGLNSLTSALRSAKKGVTFRSGGPLLIRQTAADERTAASIIKTLEDTGQAKGVTGAVTAINSFFRLLQTTYDVSAPMIQGALLLFRHPDIWTSATGHGLESLFDPLARSRFIVDHTQAIKAAINNGVEFGTSEFMEAGGSKFLAGQLDTRRKLFRPLNPTGKALGTSMAPYQRAFDSYGDVARFYAHEALRPLAKSPEDIKVLADYVNHMTGMFNSAKLGVSTRQRAIESFFLFSPRYLRAQAALIKDIFEAPTVKVIAPHTPLSPGVGLRFKLASNVLASYAFYGYLSYMLIAKALDQEVKNDPRPKSAGGDGGDFMTWEIGGMRVGIGTSWLTLMRLLGSLYGHATTNPDGFASWDNVSQMGYDVARFGRGKQAPGPSLLTDYLTGSTYVGQSLEGDNFSETAAHLGSAVATHSLPLIVQSWGEGSPDRSVLDRLKSVGTQGAGLRSYSESLTTQREGEYKRLVEEHYGEGATVDDLLAGRLDVPLDEQGRLGLMKLADTDGRVTRLNELIKERLEASGSKESKARTLFFRETDAVQAKYDSDVNAASVSFASAGTEMEGAAYRTRIGDLASAASSKYNQIAHEARFKDVLARMQEKSKEKIQEALHDQNMFVGDLAYEAYKTEVVMKEDLPVAEGGFKITDIANQWGEIDWDRREAAVRQIVERYGALDKRYSADNLLDYIDERRLHRGPDRPELHPLAADLQTARDRLEPYWKLPQQLFGTEANWPTIKEWIGAGDIAHRAALERELGGTVFIKRKPVGLADIVRERLDAARTSWRLHNPDADADLADFYGYKPLSVVADTILTERRLSRVKTP